MDESFLQRLRRYDESRPGFPGEHWIVLGTGLAVWLGTRRHPWLAVRLLGAVLGGLAAARALSGRDVPRLLRRVPYAQAD